jgi:radical SAM superfamily enzyme YgiQ (UPF0313 family)
MRYEGAIFRPPSEADSYILQATIGCSWNRCTYCDMYRAKQFRVRALDESIQDLNEAARRYGHMAEKVFVGDGDALVLPTPHWMSLLEAAQRGFPRLRRVSCYAMARNVLEKTDDELKALCDAGLKQLYIGPESGDNRTLKKIAKGDDFDAHVEAAEKAHRAGMKISVIALLGIGGDDPQKHARETARLVTAMDPEFFSALTVTVVPGTPLAKQAARGKFSVPDVPDLLRELRTMVDEARPTRSLFRTNHASNYLPLAGELPKDRERIVDVIDAALRGDIPLRSERSRGL